MNQKDYKEIAGIIKYQVKLIKKLYTNKKIIGEKLSVLICVRDNLTKYFEREHSNDVVERNKPFDKEQFLKDAGVEDV